MRALAEPGAPKARDWLGAVAAGRVRARAPDLVYLEVANSLAKYVRMGELTAEGAQQRLEQILRVPIEPVTLRLLARQALALALTRGISAYDACYLALALGSGAVLVTADRTLAAHAERSALLPEAGPPAA